MGDVVPFKRRTGGRERAPHEHRRRVEWRVYSPSRGKSYTARDQYEAEREASDNNADCGTAPAVFGWVADWRAERRDVGNWEAS